MKMSSIIYTTLFVGVAGAIAGTLFAPGKGSKTRNKMARKGNLYKDYVIDKFYDFSDSITHPFESLQDEKKRLSKKVKAKAKKVKAEVNKKQS